MKTLSSRRSAVRLVAREPRLDDAIVAGAGWPGDVEGWSTSAGRPRRNGGIMRRFGRGWRPLLGLLLVSCLWTAGPAAAQSLRDLFRKVVPSVVVIRAKGRDVAAGGATRYGEIGA